MDYYKSKSSLRAKLIAHRGGKGFGLENTKEAFLNAISLGYYGLECDIQPTKDNKLIVFHDLNIKNLTGIDKVILDCTYEELTKLSLKKYDNGKEYIGKILLFRDYLEIVKKSKCKAFIELKESCQWKDVEMMFDEIKKSELPLNQCVIIANLSSLDLLIRIRNNNKKIKLQFVGRTNYQKYIQKCLDNNIDLDICQSVFEDNFEEASSFVDKFHNAGIEVNVWVINDEEILEKFSMLKVDYITTDILKPLGLGEEI